MKKGPRLDPPQILVDFRSVSQNEKREDKTPGQKAARKLLDENPTAFLKQLNEMEMEHRRASVEWKQSVMRQKVEEAPVIEDIGAEKALRLAEAVLDEWDRAQAEKKS